jgi:hypothetical protein
MIGSQSQPHREAGRLAMVGRAYSRAAVPQGHPKIASTTRACFNAGCYGKKIISPEGTAEFNQTPAVRHWSYSSYLFPYILNSGSNGIPSLPKVTQAYPRLKLRIIFFFRRRQGAGRADLSAVAWGEGGSLALRDEGGLRLFVPEGYGSLRKTPRGGVASNFATDGRGKP